MPSLHLILLDRSGRRRAWPSARFTQPGLTPDDWLSYGRRHLGRAPLPRRGIVALSCERRYPYALVAFSRRPGKKPAVLIDEPISQAALAHAREPVATLADALRDWRGCWDVTNAACRVSDAPHCCRRCNLSRLDSLKGCRLRRALAQNGTMLGHNRTGCDAMPLSTIRLELARSHEFPNGSRDRGYEFVAPLTPDGHIDADSFGQAKQQCKVKRFWPGEDERTGNLHHTRNHRWVFSYEPGEEDDESFYRLEQHVFRPGEYVTIREPDGRDYTFRVASVRPGPALKR